jgi:Spy/CpxP family protein refolding chaperone
VKASSLALVFSALSLAGVGGIYLRMDDLADRVDGVTRRAAVDRSAPADPASDETAVEHDWSGAPGAGAAASPRRMEELEQRLARLEQGRSAEASLFGGIRTEGAPVKSVARSFMPRRFYRDVDSLARDLKLTETQQDRVRDAVDRGRRRIEDILKIPDEEGKSPHERRQEARKKMMEKISGGEKPNPSDVLVWLPSLTGHHDKKIPGTNTTYGEEIGRVKKETREEITSNLTPEQKEDFEDAHIDSMLGGGGGMTSVAIGFAGPGDGASGGGAAEIEVVEETEIEIAEEDD